MSDEDLKPAVREWKPTLAVAAILVALVGAAFALQLARERAYGEPQSGERPSCLGPSRRRLADVY
jgi:hypothetical protein